VVIFVLPRMEGVVFYGINKKKHPPWHKVDLLATTVLVSKYSHNKFTVLYPVA